MSDPLTQEPPRLLDDPQLDASLRRDLEIASSHAPIAYALDPGLARFEQSIHGASTIPPGGSVSGLRVLGWFAGTVALIGGAAWLMQSPKQPAATHDAVAAVDHAGPGHGAEHDEKVRTEEDPVVGSASSDASVGSKDPRASESVAEVREVGGSGDAGTASAQAEGGGPTLDPPTPPRPASKVVQPAPTASLADEAAQINAARKALASDPGEALALMQEAEQRFPKGAMIQERRGYTILALVGLGRTAEAQERADAYLERWPKGSLARRVRDAVER